MSCGCKGTEKLKNYCIKCKKEIKPAECATETMHGMYHSDCYQKTKQED